MLANNFSKAAKRQKRVNLNNSELLPNKWTNRWKVIKLSLALFATSSFLLNNLDIIGVQQENPIPWLSISKGWEMLRPKINDKLKIVTSDQIANAKIFIEVPDNLEGRRVKDFIQNEILNGVINKKSNYSGVEVENRRCSEVISKWILNTLKDTIEIPANECIIQTLTAKDVFSSHKGQYFKRDYRVDNLYLKNIEYLTKNISEDIKQKVNANIIEYKGRKLLNLKDIKDGEKDLSNETIAALVLEQQLKEFKNGNKYLNQINKLECGSKLNNEIMNINMGFDCEIIEFEIKDVLFIGVDGKTNIISTNAIDLNLKNVRLKM